MLNLAQRPDNKHIWFPFCVATPVFALFSFGPLAARRMTRFPRFAAVFAEETWTFRSNVVESLHFATLAGAPAYLYANHAQLQRAVGEAEAEVRFWWDRVVLAKLWSRGRMGDSGANEILRLDCLRGLGFGVAFTAFWRLSVTSRSSVSILAERARWRDEGVVREEAFRLRLEDWEVEMR